MNIISSPQSLAFAADLHDYKIDSDSTITFDVKKGDHFILKEEYTPDGDWIIRTHKLGQLCAAGLWGHWPGGAVTIQDRLMDDFSFLINGAPERSSRIIASRSKVNSTPTNVQALSLASQKITHRGAPEWVSLILASGESATAYVTDTDGGTHAVSLYTHSGVQNVVTVDVSPDTISARVPGVTIYVYQIGGLRFIVDQTQYLELHSFRFLNNFECPEAVTASGPFVTKAAQKSETAFMYGVERKFRLSQRDEHTVNSGVIFSQADYKIWHELISARQVQAFIDGHWVDIIITKHKYERSFQKNVLKSVEFSFVVADPDENPQL